MNKKVVKNASWIMIGRLFQLGLTFITTMYVARYLGPGDNGKLIYVFSYVQLFLPFCTMGMNDIAVKELVDDEDNSDLTVGTMIAVRVIVSLLSMVVSVILVTLMNDDPIYRSIAILQSFSLLFQCFDTIMYFYQSRLMSQRSGMVYVLAYLFSSLFRIASIRLGKDIYWFAFAMSLDYIMLAILFVTFYLKDGNRFRFSFAEAKKLLKKSYHYIFAGVMVVIYGKVSDVLLLGKMVDEEAVGYYGAATTLCNAWPFILTAIIDSLSPLIIRTYPEDRDLFKVRLKRLYAIIFYVSIAAAIGINVLAYYIIVILYGNQYLASVTPLRIISFSTPFAYIGVARSIWMQCRDRIAYEKPIALFGAICSIALNYLLIRRYGINGAALALVLTQFLTNFIFLYVMKDTRENAKLILEAILLSGVFK